MLISAYRALLQRSVKSGCQSASVKGALACKTLFVLAVLSGSTGVASAAQSAGDSDSYLLQQSAEQTESSVVTQAADVSKDAVMKDGVLTVSIEDFHKAFYRTEYEISLSNFISKMYSGTGTIKELVIDGLDDWQRISGTEVEKKKLLHVDAINGVAPDITFQNRSLNQWSFTDAGNKYTANVAEYIGNGDNNFTIKIENSPAELKGFTYDDVGLSFGAIYCHDSFQNSVYGKGDEEQMFQDKWNPSKVNDPWTYRVAVTNFENIFISNSITNIENVGRDGGGFGILAVDGADSPIGKAKDFRNGSQSIYDFVHATKVYENIDGKGHGVSEALKFANANVALQANNEITVLTAKDEAIKAQRDNVVVLSAGNDVNVATILNQKELSAAKEQGSVPVKTDTALFANLGAIVYLESEKGDINITGNININHENKKDESFSHSDVPDELKNLKNYSFKNADTKVYLSGVNNNVYALNSDAQKADFNVRPDAAVYAGLKGYFQAVAAENNNIIAENAHGLDFRGGASASLTAGQSNIITAFANDQVSNKDISGSYQVPVKDAAGNICT